MTRQPNLKTGRVLAAVAGAAAVFGVVVGLAAAGGVSWGRAVEVPGTAALNNGNAASVSSMSCVAAGTCVAAGYYMSVSGNSQVFVASESGGHWGNAIEVPGMAALNSSGSAAVNAVSCGAAGACAAGGYYNRGPGGQRAFVASELHGHWGKAVKVPGTTSIADVTSVSCVAAGTCVAGGYYLGSSGDDAFVTSEQHGTWSRAVRLPLTTKVKSGGYTRLTALSCTATGVCAGGGSYIDASGNNQAFVTSEQHGSWAPAVEIPGTATLNKGGDAHVYSIACGAAGACVAGGYYKDGSGNYQAFIVSEQNNRWEHAIEVPGSATLNSGGNAATYSVSCAGTNTCAASGYYQDSTNSTQTFVLSKQHGSWTPAIAAPGTATPNTGGYPHVDAVACTPTHGCAAGGSYTNTAHTYQAFLAHEQNGHWTTATPVPGMTTLNSGGFSEVDSIACPSTGACAAGGYYGNGSDNQAFVTTP